jgi:hemoglobin
MTPYERLGGEPAVTALLDSLYTRGLADPLLASFLENIDIARLKAHQFAFISQALGGPQQYSVPSLVAAHAKLPIEQRHFDAFVAHLRDALEEMKAPEDLAAEIMAKVTPVSSVIVNTRSGAVQ